MRANYGYTDGSGDFFITIDTDRCSGCGDCVRACPATLFALVAEDPHDPLREGPVAIVVEAKRRKLKYECNPCKPLKDQRALPCVGACRAGAIAHSW